MKMREHIISKLHKIEAEQNIKILYACETGSRAWGFASPDSDYDVRLIYMHPPDWYLTLHDKKDSLEMMLDKGELDISGWDFKKCLQLLWKSNGALLERIQSPVVYINTEGLTDRFVYYAQQCFAPVAAMHHYLGMAKNCFADVDNFSEVKLKKLFYTLRATLACKWIADKKTIPPIVFLTLVDELDFEPSLKIRIKQLIEIKVLQNETYMHPAENELNNFIRKQIVYFESIASGLAGRANKEVDLDEFFRAGLKTYWK